MRFVKVGTLDDMLIVNTLERRREVAGESAAFPMRETPCTPPGVGETSDGRQRTESREYKREGRACDCEEYERPDNGCERGDQRKSIRRSLLDGSRSGDTAARRVHLPSGHRHPPRGEPSLQSVEWSRADRSGEDQLTIKNCSPMSTRVPRAIR